MLVNGIACDIILSGEKANEYAPRSKLGSYREGYIQAQEGKQFAIKVDVGAFPPGVLKFQIAVWIDGIAAAFEGPCIPMHNNSSFFIREARYTTIMGHGTDSRGKSISKTLTFPSISSLSYNLLDVNGEEELGSLGTIAVQVGLVIDDMSDDFEQEFLYPLDFPDVKDDNNAHSDGSKRLNSNERNNVPPLADRTAVVEGVHSASYPEHRRPMFHELVFVEGPTLATFVFRYRSRKFLVENDIATNEELLDEELDQMTIKEMRAEIKASRERMGHRESNVTVDKPMKQEEGVKRRRTE